MKKSTLFVVLAVIAVMLIAWVGCTTKATVEETGPKLADIVTKWEGSGHADATSEAFVHWNDADPAEIPPTCAKCHSTDGARDFFGADGTEAGKVDVAHQINDPVSCTACHSTAVAAANSVTLPSGAVLENTGVDTACSTCHSGMGSSTAVAKKIEGLPVDEVVADSTMMGAHYFAVAAMHAGSDGYSGFQYEGKTYTGTVTRLMSFGAFVEILPGKEGLLHVSQYDYTRVEKIEDVLSVGDKVDVKLTEIDSQGRLNISRKALLEKPEGYEERPERPRNDRNDRGGRDNRDRNNRGGNSGSGRHDKK